MISFGPLFHAGCGALVATVLVVGLAPALAAETPTVPPPAFTAYVLPNGLKVWHGYMPGVRESVVSLAVHVGSREGGSTSELAHLLEHVLLGERSGPRSQPEIERLGGTSTGSTSPTTTFYRVRVPAEHTAFAVGWVARVVTPRKLDPGIVAGEAERVLLELAQPASRTGDWLERLLSDEHDRGRTTASWVRRMDAAALEAFHLQHYHPRNLTLLVIGDSPADVTREAAERALGHWGDRPQPAPPAIDPRPLPGLVRHRWGEKAELRYGWTLPRRQAADPMRHAFLCLWLEQRLEQNLLWADERPIYGFTLRANFVRDRTEIALTTTVNPVQLDLARRIIEREVGRIARTELADTEFAAERDRVLLGLGLRFRWSTTIETSWWVRFGGLAALHDSFPDPRTTFRDYTRAELASAIGTALMPGETQLFVTRLNPLGPAMRTVVGWACFAATFGLTWLGVRRWAPRGRWRFGRPLRLGLAALIAPPLMLGAAAAYPIVQDKLTRQETYWLALTGQQVPALGLGILAALALLMLAWLLVDREAVSRAHGAGS